MIITIATPLWPPEIGGPANYAKNLAREFQAAGHQVRVVSFYQGGKAPDAGNIKKISFVSLKFPTGVRHFLFFCKLLPKVAGADILLALDQFSAGWPAAAACLIFKKSLILRVEGDFLWESFVQRTRKDITLRKFYEKTPVLSWREHFIKMVVGWVLKKADCLVFSSEWRKRMIVGMYRISEMKMAIIRNVFPSPMVNNVENCKLKIENSRIILWAGRMLYLKNLARLIHAFVKANDGSYELYLIGDGPEKKNLQELIKKENIAGVKFFSAMSRDKLGEKYKEAMFFVLPSFSEVGPNVIAETVAAGTPFIMTRESGYAEYIKDFGLFIDPLDEEGITSKIKMLMDKEIRGNMEKHLLQFFLYRSWQDAACDWIMLFRDQQSAREN